MSGKASVRVTNRRAAVVLHGEASIAIELEDGTLVGFLHVRPERKGTFSAFFELGNAVEEIGVNRAGRLISFRRREGSHREGSHD